MGSITEAQVGDLLGIVKTNDVSVEVKVSCVGDMKSAIKHYTVPDSVVATVFDIIRATLASQHLNLAAAGFSALSQLFKRLAIQEPRHIIYQAPHILPSLLDRLADQRIRLRALAVHSLGELWKICPQEVEGHIRDIALVNKSSRMKEGAMEWVTKMSKEYGLQFRSFVPKMVDALEDADGMVRETAKVNLVLLFQNAPLHAKADLNKQLQQRNVRKSIMTDVLSQLSSNAPLNTEPHTSTQVPTQTIIPPVTHHEIQQKDTSSTERASADSRPQSRTSLLSDHDVDHIEPAYVNTHRELEEIFRQMHPHFEGRESEQNWLHREKSILKLRQLTKGNAPKDFQVPFLAGIKGLLDGILKVANSLRTTLSTNGCCLIQELARAAGAGLDPMVEILLQNFVKLCAGTKKISSQNGNLTVDIVCANVSYNVRTLQHIWAACQDKNVQPRSFATGWLKTIITKHRHHRGQLEHAGGLDYIEKCIKRGLADANPGVRESMRKTYWVFAGSFPDRAESFMASLDANSKRSLEKDSANPHAGKSTMQAIEENPVGKPSASRSTTTGPPSRASLKEAIAARKREAAAAKDPIQRPGSAQSSFSPPVKHAPILARIPSGFASAPIRPLRAPRRPELIRPATAEPYSIRRTAKATSPVGAPGTNSVKGNPRTDSPNVSPARARPRKVNGVGLSPTKSDLSSPDNGIPGFARKDEELTMLMPRLNSDSIFLSTSNQSRTMESRELLPLSVPSPSFKALPSPEKARKENRPPVENGHQIAEPSSGSGDNVGTTKTGLSLSVESELVPAVSALKVYEDPVGSPEDEVPGGTLMPSTVLEERTINEPVNTMIVPHAIVTDQEVKKIYSSPYKRGMSEQPEDMIQARRLLDGGIARVRARNLDAHGFRKLQGLLKTYPDIWPDLGRFSELLTALLEYLQTPFGNMMKGHQVDFARLQDLKVQVLGTVRLMMDSQFDFFRPLVPQTLAAIITARKYCESRSHVVRVLEATAKSLYALAGPDLCVEAVLQAMDGEDRETGKPSICMGFAVLGGSLRDQRLTWPLGRAVEQRLCSMAVRFMNDGDPDIRHSVTEYCVDLYSCMESKATFWRLIGPTAEDHRSLITYYLARKEEEQRNGEGASAVESGPSNGPG